MPQAFGRVLLGQFGQIEARGKVIADAMDSDRADVVGQVRERVADRKDDAVVKRVALGRAIEPDSQNPAGLLDLEQVGWSCTRGIGSVSHASIRSCPEKLYLITISHRV